MFVTEPTHGNPWQRQTTVEFSSEASTVVTWESGTRDSNDQFYVLWWFGRFVCRAFRAINSHIHPNLQY